MASTLRDLLIQRAARLQERPALSAPGWGTLSYAQLRNRAEGVALGLLAAPGTTPSACFAATGTPWDWMAELGAAAAGLIWAPEGTLIPLEVLGGPAFNAEAGRGPYHQREQTVTDSTLFHGGLTQGDLMHRLARLNQRLGWDHETTHTLAAEQVGTPTSRAILWSALYAGAHLTLGTAPPQPSARGIRALFGSAPPPALDEGFFEGFWDHP